MAHKMSDKKVPMRIMKSTSKDYDSRPSFSVSETEVPEIKDWSVGKEYEFHVKVKQMGTRIVDYEPNKGKIESTFKVIAIKAYTEKTTE